MCVRERERERASEREREREREMYDVHAHRHTDTQTHTHTHTHTQTHTLLEYVPNNKKCYAACTWSGGSLRRRQQFFLKKIQKNSK